jgi:hypothetical protein
MNIGKGRVWLNWQKDIVRTRIDNKKLWKNEIIQEKKSYIRINKKKHEKPKLAKKTSNKL